MAKQMIDLTLVEPSAALEAVPATLADTELAQFSALVRAKIAEHAPLSVAAGTVVVQPGGATFTTISAALASITDASQKKQYVVYIGAGTYNEVVVCKSWVFLQGVDEAETLITAPSTADFAKKGTIVGASNSAIQNLAAQSVGSAPKSWAVAVVAYRVTNFDIENCQLISTDPVGGANMMGLAVDYLSGASGSVVYMAYTSVFVDETNGLSQPLGVFAYSSTFLQVTQSKIVSRGGIDSYGAASNYKSNLTLDNSYVQGDGYSLAIPNFDATCIANGCELVGPVENGVIVNP